MNYERFFLWYLIGFSLLILMIGGTETFVAFYRKKKHGIPMLFFSLLGVSIIVFVTITGIYRLGASRYLYLWTESKRWLLYGIYLLTSLVGTVGVFCTLRLKWKLLLRVTLVLCLIVGIGVGFVNTVFHWEVHLPDLKMEIPDREEYLIVREYQILFGSGGSLYLVKDGKEIYLDRIYGGDDGYCAFQDGNYTIRKSEQEGFVLEYDTYLRVETVSYSGAELDALSPGFDRIHLIWILTASGLLLLYGGGLWYRKRKIE